MYTIIYRPEGQDPSALVLQGEDDVIGIASYDTLDLAASYFDLEQGNEDCLEVMLHFVEQGRPAFCNIDSIEDIFPYIRSREVSHFGNDLIEILCVKLDPAFLEGKKLIDFELPKPHRVPVALQ